MSRNVLREIRNQVRTEGRMQAQFAEGRTQAMKEAEEYISSLYTDGQETIDFWFDGFQLWERDLPEDVVAVFNRMLPDDKRRSWGNNGKAYFLDDWNRGVLTLTKERAIEMEKAVQEWNRDWEASIARHYDVDQSCYRHSYWIAFGKASGTEHTISVGRYFTTSWQKQ
jgi:hypothetical protein